MADPASAPRRASRRIRCAIYTRKSTEEGLDQAFNSLDAQREACAAFILSQKHEGWVLSPKLYDDGGYTGGNLERPALKALMADIEAGQIDAIVVYKVDRLTRALSDFAKLVEVFDRQGVSFVSITQQFNTTTSMGRLTLNVLLSFAQFEREVIGERVRDKIAASKKKGMWMGGVPSLGYDVKDRKLIVNEPEARQVVDIYQRYLALKSVHLLRADLARAGIRSKQRFHADGTAYGGRSFSDGALYLMLQNRIYRGEITHKGQSYPGEHQAIIDEGLWDAVQALLAQNRVAQVSGLRARQSSPLIGMIFDAKGDRLSPTHANKKGTRYRYYISTRLLTGPKNGSGLRLPAADVEGLLINRLQTFLADPAAILEAMRETLADSSLSTLAIERGREAARDLPALAPDRLRAMLLALQCRIMIHPDRVEIALSRLSLAAWLAGDASIPSAEERSRRVRGSQVIRGTGSVSEDEDLVILRAPALLKRVGREMRLLVMGATDTTPADPTLLKLLARAHRLQARLIDNTDLRIKDLAASENVSPPYVYALLKLPWLAPDIVSAILEGRQPDHLNASRLMQLVTSLPGDWAKQRALLGFD